MQPVTPMSKNVIIEYIFFSVKPMKQIPAFSLAFILSLLLTLPQWAWAKPETLAWKDLLPQLTDSLTLEDDIAWGDRVRLDLDQKRVRIPGFIVPLEYDQQVVTSFLLVPYFGACIHEPPPPPNQTVYAQFEPGHELEAIWMPVWVEGKISTDRVEASLATASYSLNVEKIELYEY
jgi:hypothetical protein